MKQDEAFKETEKLLNQLESDIHKEYAQATKEMSEKVDAYFAKFKDEDEKQKALWKDGKISKKEYTEWRQRKMLTGKRYTQMRDTLAADLTKTDEIAMKMVGNKMVDVYALNMNYGTYSIEHDSKIDTSFTLYNHAAVERLIKTNPAILPIPKPNKMEDYKWNKQHLQSALTQGILQGESIDKIAQRFQRVSGMDERGAIRNARTAVTGAQNGGRFDAMERAKAEGVGLKKVWMATLDNRVRDSHAILDGEEKELDEEFSNGLLYPGDAEGEPSEVYNCRCRMVHQYDKYKTDWSNMDLRNDEKLGDMSYEEWKEAHGAPKAEPEEIKPEDVKADNNYEIVSTKQEAFDSLNSIFTDVDKAFLKLDEELAVDNVNRFNELNARFKAIKEKNGSWLSVSSRKKAIAYVSGGFRTPDVELSLNKAWYKDAEKLQQQEEHAKKTSFSMPFADAFKNTYTITHEYGHILEAAISRGRTDFDEIDAQLKSIVRPSGTQMRDIWRNAERSKADDIRNEIIDIAKEHNKDFDLEKNLSRYGHTNSYEFFAEVFANSQCGEPNELGMAMEEWLKKEGF